MQNWKLAEDLVHAAAIFVSSYELCLCRFRGEGWDQNIPFRAECSKARVPCVMCVCGSLYLSHALQEEASLKMTEQVIRLEI